MHCGTCNIMSDVEQHGAVLIDLSAAIINLREDEPVCCLVGGQDGLPKRLPFGPFFPPEHRTMEIGLRQWVREQVGVGLGHVEQLYTFGDRGRHLSPQLDRDHVVSVGYLALTRFVQTENNEIDVSNAQNNERQWGRIYEFFPFEDWRNGRPAIIDSVLLPAIKEWCFHIPDENLRAEKERRVSIAFGTLKNNWDEELVLERYELLYEAGLVPEALTDERIEKYHASSINDNPTILGKPLQLDHRRILATALGRLRGKMKYRPVIFDLVPKLFTLGQLQAASEAILGVSLHKQNFRRMTEKSNMLESTGKIARARGRPAELFCLRQGARLEGTYSGLRLPIGRNKT